MHIVNSQSFLNFCQRPVGGIEKSISGSIILWSDPLPFHNPPESLYNVQMWGVGRNVEDKKPPLFPNRTHLSNLGIPVYTGVFEHNNCLFGHMKRILVEEVNDLIGINRFTCTESLEVVVTVNHIKYIQSFGSFRRNTYIFSGKLPSVWNVAFGTNMRFITVKEVDFFLCIESFKFLQLLRFVCVELRRGYILWTFSYTSISCANADKKRRNVKSPASLPEEFCHASLAERTLCLSDSIAFRTASSSEQSMMGFRPCPGRVFKPLIPSVSNRFTQPLTLWAVISVWSPTCAELKPSDLSNTQRQRIRKQWLSPLRKPEVNSQRSDSVSVNILIFIRMYILYMANIRQFYHM